MNKYDGITCPYCGGRDIGPAEIPQNEDTFEMTQKMECENCEAVWLDVYKLEGYEEIME